MKDGTTILFGLPEVAVERVARDSDGARTVHVVTAAETAAALLAGLLLTSVKQYRTIRPRLRRGAGSLSSPFDVRADR